MWRQKLREKYDELILRIQKHPFFTVVVALFVIYFFIFVFTTPFNAPYKESLTRTSLPQIHLPEGTLTLVTEPEAGMTPVIHIIQNAKKSVDLVMYEFTDKTIADALIRARATGTRVRVLLNQGYYGTQEKNNELAYAYLKSHKVDVQWTPATFALTHQKTLIADNTKVFIMTYNFVPKYYPTSRDFGIVDVDQKDVTAIEDTFDADWNNTQTSIDYGDDLVWSPNSENDMLLIINSAKKSLEVYNEEMQDIKIVDALEKASARGVDVKIVMTYETSWKKNFNQLKNSGIDIHLFHGEKGTYIHAKVIIADDDYAFLGSENFSFGSLQNNRELGIFFSDPAIISSLEPTFTADFQNAKPY